MAKLVTGDVVHSRELRILTDTMFDNSGNRRRKNLLRATSDVFPQVIDPVKVPVIGPDQDQVNILRERTKRS